VTEPPRPSWQSLLGVIVAALAILVAADLVAWRVAPPHYLREVQEGVEDYAKNDPLILALGSSHARTFHALGEELARRTANRVSVVAVPVESGKLTSYQWVLAHRLRPLVEERQADGRLARRNLSRFILITEWWDTCSPKAGELATNLPSRAWRAGDFMADVIGNGMTSFNRNYLQTRWRRLWRISALVQDRGYGRILVGLADWGLGPDSARDRIGYDQFLRYWQDLQEGGSRCMGDPTQIAALRSMLEFFRGRGIAITIVLEPRKPATITPRALAETFNRFTPMIEAIAKEYGAQVIDLSTKTPLLDSDFAADFDHVTPEGNRKFAEWALDHDLRFLLDDVAAPSINSPAPGRNP
jgi:hypothetical protein